MKKQNIIISAILIMFSLIMEITISYKAELDIYWYGNFMFITLNAVTLLLFNLNYVLKKVYYIILSLISVIPIIIIIFNFKYVGIHIYPTIAIKLTALSILLYIFSPQMIFIYYKNSLYNKIECSVCNKTNNMFNKFCYNCGNKIEHKNKILNCSLIISIIFQITGTLLLLFCKQLFEYIFISVKAYYIFNLLYLLLFSFLIFIKINEFNLNKIINAVCLLFVIISSVILDFITYNSERFLFVGALILSILNILTYILILKTFRNY